MKIIILAGGEAARLQSVARGVPKPLVLIKGEAILTRIVLFFYAFGINDVGIIANKKEERFFRDWSKQFPNTTGQPEPTFFWENKRAGTFGCLREAKKWLYGSDFMVTNGDCLLDFDLERLYKFYKIQKRIVVLPLLRNIARGRYASVKKKNGVVKELEIKEVLEGNRVSAGPYLFRSSIFAYDNKKSNLNIEADIFPQLISQGEIVSIEISPSRCIDCGTVEGWKQAGVLW